MNVVIKLEIFILFQKTLSQYVPNQYYHHQNQFTQAAYYEPDHNDEYNSPKIKHIKPRKEHRKEKYNEYYISAEMDYGSKRLQCKCTCKKSKPIQDFEQNDPCCQRYCDSNRNNRNHRDYRDNGDDFNGIYPPTQYPDSVNNEIYPSFPYPSMYYPPGVNTPTQYPDSVNNEIHTSRPYPSMIYPTIDMSELGKVFPWITWGFPKTTKSDSNGDREKDATSARDKTSTRDDRDNTSTKDDRDKTSTKHGRDTTNTEDDRDNTSKKYDKNKTSTKDDRDETDTEDGRDKTSTIKDSDKTSTIDDKDKTSTTDDTDKSTTTDDKVKTSTTDDRDKTTTKDDKDKTRPTDDRDKTTTKDDKDKTRPTDDRDKTTTKDDKDITSTKDDKDKTSTTDDTNKTTPKDDKDETNTTDDREKTTTKDDKDKTSTRDDKDKTTTNEDKGKTSEERTPKTEASTTTKPTPRSTLSTLAYMVEDNIKKLIEYVPKRKPCLRSDCLRKNTYEKVGRYYEDDLVERPTVASYLNENRRRNNIHRKLYDYDDRPHYGIIPIPNKLAKRVMNALRS